MRLKRKTFNLKRKTIMKQPFTDAYNVLKIMGVPVFTNADNDRLGNFSINAEDPKAHKWCEYYAQFTPGWEFGVRPTLNNVLAQFGLFAEWQNPGCLGVYEA